MGERNVALKNLKVLDLGQVIAGNFASVLLADFGANVIKVEKPEIGDNLRHMGVMHDDVSLQFTVENRNKKCITLDIKTEKGKEVLLKLVKMCDVVIENFAPGVMEGLGLGFEELKGVNPRIIMARISGYGQNGPKKNLFGYDRIAMAYGGLTYLTGFTDRPPLRPGLAVADYMAGLFCAYGILAAVYNRDVVGTGVGQVVDMSLYESVFRIMESAVVDYKLTGTVRERTGNRHILSTPGEHYKTKDGKWLVIAVANDRVFERFAKGINREDLLEDSRFNKQVERSKTENKDIIEDITSKWVEDHTLDECLRTLSKGVPMSPILSIEDIFKEQQYIEREDIIEVMQDELGMISMQGVVPKLSETPGKIEWAGSSLGKFNEEIYKGLLGLSEEEYNDLIKNNII